MARGQKQIEGQYELELFNYDPSNYVVQSNLLVMSKQTLKLNSSKIIRAAIMQVVKEDMDLKVYKISVKELADLIGIDPSNLYRCILDIIADIQNNWVTIYNKNGDKDDIVTYPWVQVLMYKSDVGLLLKLNDSLKPYLLNLKTHYTQYALEDVMSFNSVYTIRIYELLLCKVYSRAITGEGIDVEYTVEELKSLCGCKGKSYDSFGNFKARVLDKAVDEINENTLYRISYSYKKEGRTVASIVFNVNRYFNIKKIEKHNK